MHTSVSAFYKEVTNRKSSNRSVTHRALARWGVPVIQIGKARCKVDLAYLEQAKAAWKREEAAGLVKALPTQRYAHAGRSPEATQAILQEILTEVKKLTKAFDL